MGKLRCPQVEAAVSMHLAEVEEVQKGDRWASSTRTGDGHGRCTCSSHIVLLSTSKEKGWWQAAGVLCLGVVLEVRGGGG